MTDPRHLPALLAALVDGQAADNIPLLDRGLQYGDGLFETIAVEAGRPRRWDRHMRRLRAGAERLGIPLPEPGLLRAELDRLLHTCSESRLVAKVIVTRGSGGRGYRPPLPAHPLRIVSLHPWPNYPPDYEQTGVRVRTCRTPIGESPALAGLKHLSRLEHVLARAEWDDPSIPEGLVCTEQGLVIEATQANLFLVENSRIGTPDLSRSGVAGIMREVVIEVAREQGLEVSEEEIPIERLHQADELFLTNSVIGIWPVREAVGRCFPAPGPLTQSLRDAARNRD